MSCNSGIFHVLACCTKNVIFFSHFKAAMMRSCVGELSHDTLMWQAWDRSCGMMRMMINSWIIDIRISLQLFYCLCIKKLKIFLIIALSCLLLSIIMSTSMLTKTKIVVKVIIFLITAVYEYINMQIYPTAIFFDAIIRHWNGRQTEQKKVTNYINIFIVNGMYIN